MCLVDSLTFWGGKTDQEWNSSNPRSQTNQLGPVSTLQLKLNINKRNVRQVVLNHHSKLLTEKQRSRSATQGQRRIIATLGNLGDGTLWEHSQQDNFAGKTLTPQKLLDINNIQQLTSLVAWVGELFCSEQHVMRPGPAQILILSENPPERSHCKRYCDGELHMFSKRDAVGSQHLQCLNKTRLFDPSWVYHRFVLQVVLPLGGLPGCQNKSIYPLFDWT